MAKRTTKTATRSKARATTKASAKKRTTTKAKAGKTKATAKKRTTTKAKAKTTTKASAKKRTTTKAKAKTTTKAAAKKRTTTKAAAKKRATTKAAAKKRTTTKAKAKTTTKAAAKKRAATKAAAKKRTAAKAAAKKRAATKAAAKKRTATKAAAKKRTTTKAAAKKRTTTRAAAKKRTTTKAKAKTRATASTKKRATARKSTTTRAKAKSTPRKSASTASSVKGSSEFDFNAWLLPTLELEQYEPNIEEVAGVKDKSKGSSTYAWIGSGQCGGRLVKSFYDLGYHKALAVNTTNHDLELLSLPQDQKFLMDIGEKGAGKDASRGQAAVHQHQQEILHLAMQKFGTEVDHIMVAFGAGGGTGSGSAEGLIEIAKKYARYIGLENPNKHVGVVMTLPTLGEASSPMVAENAYNVATRLSELASAGEISPLIIVDNDKVHKMYPGMTVRSFWPSINSTVASLFDIFNRLSALNSRYTSYDPVDHNSVMQAGGCSIMGLTKVDKYNDKFAVSEAVKQNLHKTLLASGFDLSSAKLAGSIFVGGRKILGNVKGLQGSIDYAFDVLSEVTGNATVHRGIYEDDRDSLRVYTIIGGLEAPTARLEELRSHSGVVAQ